MPVYLIDDDEDMLASTLFLLDSVGVAARAYADPMQFLQQARTLAPGCVLSDLRMPAMSGIELHAALREQGIGWPVVLMSGHADSLASAEANTDIVTMIEKPFSLERLMEAIGRAFSILREDAAVEPGRSSAA